MCLKELWKHGKCTKQAEELKSFKMKRWKDENLVDGIKNAGCVEDEREGGDEDGEGDVWWIW